MFRRVINALSITRYSQLSYNVVSQILHIVAYTASSFPDDGGFLLFAYSALHKAQNLSIPLASGTLGAFLFFVQIGFFLTKQIFAHKSTP